MKDRKNGLLLQTKKQMNNGAIATGAGFVLYMALLVAGLELAADLVAIAFGVVGIYVSLSVLEGRRRDREDVSYNLLWGQLALTILLVACAVLAVRQRLGLAPLVSDPYTEACSSGTSAPETGPPSASRWRFTRLRAHRKHSTWTATVMVQLTG